VGSLPGLFDRMVVIKPSLNQALLNELNRNIEADCGIKKSMQCNPWRCVAEQVVALHQYDVVFRVNEARTAAR